jgi:ribosome maturation factor RimP
MSIPERVRSLIEPLVDDQGLVLYDLELNGGVLRVVVEQPIGDRPVEDRSEPAPDAPGGVGMDAITPLTRAISRALDEHDPIDGHFTLEVSSPGLERILRTPEHFRGAIGQVVSIKTTAEAGGDRRFRGRLTEADDDGVVVVPDVAPDQPRRLAYPEVERARTVFDWGPTPKPGGGSTRTKRRASGAPKSTKKTTKKVTAS